MTAASTNIYSAAASKKYSIAHQPTITTFTAKTLNNRLKLSATPTLDSEAISLETYHLIYSFHPLHPYGQLLRPSLRSIVGALAFCYHQVGSRASSLLTQLQHADAIVRDLAFLLITSTTNCVRLINATDADGIAETRQVATRQMGKKFSDFECRYDLDLGSLKRQDGSILPSIDMVNLLEPYHEPQVRVGTRKYWPRGVR